MRVNIKEKTISILLVEDDDVDVLKVKRAFEKCGFANPLSVVENGMDALQILREARKSPESMPRLILLDLNMPRMNGIEFLRELRTDPELKQISVVVLTTSKDERDIVAAYQYNVAGYVLKPVAFQDFVQALSTIEAYWNLCELPESSTNE